MNINTVKQTVVRFIVKNVGTRGVLIGLSGGVDSALSCALAVEALGSDKVTALIVKNIRYSNEHLAVARRLANQLGITTIEIDTNTARQAVLDVFERAPEDVEQVSSLDARLTDLLLRTTAQQRGLIYLGSINGTERLTGWYPKGSLFGDFCPIGGLLKVQIQALARHLKLPAEIVETVSDDASRICSGCGLLPEFAGIPYQQLDAVLLHYEQTGHFTGAQQSRAVVAKIKRRVAHVDHKQHVFPSYPVINTRDE